MGSPLQTIGDVAARIASGIFGGAGTGAAIFQAGSSAATAGVSLVSPLIGGALGLIGMLGSSTDPPEDPLTPLKRAEIALARGNIGEAREHARTWNERLEGRIVGRLRPQLPGPRIAQRQPVTMLPQGRDLDVIAATQRIAGGRTARELLSLLDFGGEPKNISSSFLLPRGSITPPDAKARFLAEPPLELRRGDWSTRELAALYAQPDPPKGVRGQAFGAAPEISIGPSVAPLGAAASDYPGLADALQVRLTSGSGLRRSSTPNPLHSRYLAQLERLGGFVAPQDTPPAPVASPAVAASPPSPPAPAPASPGADMRGVPTISLAQFGAIAKASREPAGTGEPVSNTGLLGGLNSALGGFVSAINPILTAATPVAQQYVASRFSSGALPGGTPMPLPMPTLPAGNPGYQQAFVGNFDLPGFDVAPQGAADLFSPFRTTANGTQVAKPYAATKANGKTEWFIPAGQPTGFTKASRKKRRTCRPR